MRIKRLFLITILTVSLTIYGFCQSNENLNKKTYFGLYGGFGYINPADINEQLDIYADNAGIEFQSGNGHINIAYIFGASLNYFVLKNLEIKGDFEFAWAHKQMKRIIQSDYFNDLIRLSGGLYGNYHYFLENFNSVYLGGGLNYNSLILSAFNDRISGKSTPIGYSIQIGYLANIVNSKKKKRQIFYELQCNLINGENKESQEVSELSFSGIALKFGYKF